MAERSACSGHEPTEPLKRREMEILRLKANDPLLTNREIAEHLFIAESTVKTYINGINQQLGTKNLREAVACAEQFALIESTGDSPKHNLPAQTTPFVGREQEMGELEALLADPDVRLLTILAPGGMGKTRLALAVGERILTRPQPLPKVLGRGEKVDAVYFAPLAALSDPARIVTAIGEYCGYQFQGDGREPKQQLLDFLREKRWLLILDNFEHLLKGAALVSEILAAAPALKVLATSRERLKLSGEKVYSIGGMGFADRATPEVALASDAAQLFVQGAQLVRGDFALRDTDSRSLGRICRLTEGMPLALVLAAAWVDVLSLAEIATELQKSVDFLAHDARDAPERHHSVRAVFEPTWERLSDTERHVFMHFSVFRGGCTREAAQVVTGATLRDLQIMVNKALIEWDGESGRYEIHELLRQYSEARLEDAGEAAAARDAHSIYYLHFLAEREAKIVGHGQKQTFAELGREFENIRMGWLWALEREAFDRIHAAAKSLSLFCVWSGRHVAGHLLFETGLEAVVGRAGEEPLWAHLIAVQHFFNYRRQKFDDLAQALAIAQAHNNRADIADLLLSYAEVEARHFQNFQKALELTEQALNEFQALDDRAGAGWALGRMGYCSGLLGRLEESIDYLQRSVALLREIGHDLSVGWSLMNLAHAIGESDQYEASIDTFQEALAIGQHVDSPQVIAHTSIFLSQIYFTGGEFDEAQALADEAAGMAAALGNPTFTATCNIVLGLLASLRGEYTMGEQLGSQGLALVTSNPAEIPIGNGSVAIALCGLGRVWEAGSYIQEMLADLSSRSSVHLNGIGCAVGALYLYEIQRFEQAASMLSFVLNAGYKTFGWAHSWPLLHELEQKLKAELDGATFDVAWERGRSLDLETVREELLAEFGEARVG